MNRSDDGLIEKPELVIQRFVNCVVHDDGLSIYMYIYRYIYLTKHSEDVFSRYVNFKGCTGNAEM